MTENQPRYVIGFVHKLSGKWEYKLVPVGYWTRDAAWFGFEDFETQEEAREAAHKHAAKLGLNIGKLNG